MQLWPFLRFWRLAHFASLDVVLGSLLSARMAARLAGSSLAWGHYFCLGAAVFLIYSLDRLADLRKYQGQGLSALPERHAFVGQHRRLFLGLCALLMASGAWVAWCYLPGPVLRFGLGLGAFSGFYLLSAYRLPRHSALWFPKEGAIALIYTAGIWGSVVAHQPPAHPFLFWGATGVYGLIAVLNLMLFSLMEQNSDRRRAEFNLAEKWGAETLGTAYPFLVLLGGSGLLLLLFFAENGGDFRVISALFLMVLGLGALWWRFARPGKATAASQAYRYLGDGLFMLAAIGL